MIYIKSEQEIEKMKRANKLVMEILSTLKNMVIPGLNIEKLEKKALYLSEKGEGIPAFKGYNGYPSALCVSINEVIIHGIPELRILKEGDIVGIDFGILLDGFYGDAAITVPVGKVDNLGMKLIEVTEQALYEGIQRATSGNRIGDVSYAIQSFVEKHEFSVIREFTGHGIGKELHEDPLIPNYGKPGTGVVIEKGMTFALEPMVAAGGFEVDILSDGWTAVTKDRSLSAHFEHTIAIGEEGAEILSQFS
ncbi:MAG: type I methionyl aminopeptidase [Candidatus Cloacimonadota bacterium]|nr:MAG: type I methionyl aminopeptidase [Candidatus Cloacimonadota bacterium]